MHHERDPQAINAETRPEIGYEIRDISVKGIAGWTIGFFVGTIITIGLVLGLFLLLVPTPIRPDTPPETVPGAPNPLLQSGMQVKLDIRNLRREEDRKLNGYGWVNREKGIVSVPIEQAMEQVAREGLSAPAPGGQP